MSLGRGGEGGDRRWGEKDGVTRILLRGGEKDGARNLIVLMAHTPNKLKVKLTKSLR